MLAFFPWLEQIKTNLIINLLCRVGNNSLWHKEHEYGEKFIFS